MSVDEHGNRAVGSARERMARAIRLLLLPFTVLREGHVWLALFQGVLVASAVFGASELSGLVIREISRAKIETREVRFALYLFAKTVPWLVIGPLVLTAIVLPIRILWFQRDQFLSRSIEALGEAVSVCYRTCWVALSVMAIDLAAGFTLLAVHEIGIAKLDDTSAMRLLLYAALLAISLGVAKNLATFFSPLVGVITLWDPYYSVDMAKEILRGTLWRLTVTVSTGISACLAVHYTVHGSTHVNLATLAWWEVAAHSSIAWYTITLVGCAIASHIDEKEKLWEAESQAASSDASSHAGDRIPFPL